MESMPLSAGETVEVVDGVHLTQLAAGERMSVQHFHIEPGSTVPAHSHEHEQVGFVYRGTMTFQFDGSSDGESLGEEIVVGSNESFAIPSEEEHAAANRGDEPVRGLDIFAPPRPNPDWE